MIKRSVCFLLLITFLGATGFSQIRVKSELEVGVNYSGMRLIDAFYAIDPLKYRPKISPVIGFWTKVKFGSRFSYNLGVQYLKVGYNSYYTHDRINQFHNYTTEEWESLTFEKFSIPLTMGYDLKFKKTESTIYLGIKSNYFINGEIKVRSKFTDRKDPKSNSENSSSQNPFAEGPFLSPASRWNKGVFCGIGVKFSERLNVNISYSYLQFTDWSGGCFGNSYNNNDLTFSVKYSLLSKLKRTTRS